MPETITITRCAGGNHVTLTVTNDVTGVRKVTLNVGDVGGKLSLAALVELFPKEADLIYLLRDEIKKVGATTFAQIKAAVEGKVYNP